MSAETYPLEWPAGRPRTELRRRQHARFDTPFASAVAGLFHELKLLGASYPVLSTNMPLKRDGLPYAPKSLTASKRQEAVDDPGAAVYFQWESRQYAFACDRWLQVDHNVQAIRLSIGAIRGMDRWGTGDMVRAGFEGFKALPPGHDDRPWWEVLGVERGDMSRKGVKDIFKTRLMEAHPDHGGSEEETRRLLAARDQALAEVKE